MTLTKWKPIDGVKRTFDEDFPVLSWKPFRAIERLFDEDFPYFAMPKLGFDLACDIYEKDKDIIVEINLPGIDPEKLDVVVEEDHLKVSGSREEKKEVDEKCFCSREIKRGYFQRTIDLPQLIKKEKAEAEYKDGVLRVTMPKDEEASKDRVKLRVRK